MRAAHFGLTNMKKIAILDFSTGIVYVRHVPEDIEEKEGDDILEFFAKDLSIRANDCNYMVSEDLSVDIQD